MRETPRQPWYVSIFVCLMVSLSAIAGPASIPTMAATTFSATLDGLQNVPPIPEVTATGTATLTLNDEQTQLSFVINISGLSGPEFASHIHNAGPRDNGPIAFELPLGSTKVGTWAIPPDMVTELLAGRLYINVHTDTYVAGEIRGNIIEVKVPVERSTWGRIKSLYEK